MPDTKRALDSLFSRLLRTESLATVGVMVIALLDGWRTGGAAGIAAAALILGRSFVKRGNLDA